MRCPIPYVRAKRLVPSLDPGDSLQVLFSDPEAPVDLSALAHDEGLDYERPDEQTITLRRPPRPSADLPPR